MRRLALGTALLLGWMAVQWFILFDLAGAQKVWRIGILIPDEQLAPIVEGLKTKLAELGHVSGKNVVYLVYDAKKDKQRLNRLALELVETKVDLLFTPSTTATVALAKFVMEGEPPVVFVSGGHTREFIKNYASSGSNLTGIHAAGIDLVEKRLELLRELLPGGKRVASFNNPRGVNYHENLMAVRRAAARLSITLLEVDAANPEELRAAMERVTPKTAHAIFLPADATLSAAIEIAIQAAIQKRLPLFPSFPAYVRKGGLASYGPEYFGLGQQGAVLVDKILKGAKPADLPIEQPTKLNLAINLKTAKAIGLAIPQAVLWRADEIIQ